MKRVRSDYRFHLPLTLLAVLTLCACSKQQPAGEAKLSPAQLDETKQMMALVKSNLTPSEAVQYGVSVFGKDGTRACLEYRAKSHPGDESGNSYARFKKTGGTWSLETMDSPGDACSQGGFDDLDMEDSTKLEAIAMATAALQKSRKLTKEEATKLVTDASPDMDCFSTSVILARNLYKVAHDKYYHSLTPDYQINPVNQANVDIIMSHLNKGECPEQTDLADELKK